jgi:hypothetical protein
LRGADYFLKNLNNPQFFSVNTIGGVCTWKRQTH